MRASSVAVLASLLAACSSSPSPEPTRQTTSAIEHPVEATDYPESVLVNFFCSGTLLAPKVVLTAGHCQGAGPYTITAPHAGGQVATGSHDQSFFDGDPKTSHDLLLVFLDTPITIDTYPTLASALPPSGTVVVDIGRSQDGQISSTLWKTTDDVLIRSGADDLGLPYNVEALPDLSQSGDSGGAIMKKGTHELLAVVDTDTIEQSIDAGTPIDLFARVDQLHDDLVAATTTGPAPTTDSGADDADASTDAPAPSSGGCAETPRTHSTSPGAALVVMAAAALLVRRRRSRRTM